MANLYIIAGCNGAGKTTASMTVLPELLECYEFVNADNIAAGLSPLNPEGAAIRAGRLMLERIDYLLEKGVDFAFETTLATKSFANFIKEAKDKGYEITLLFFWLKNPEVAKLRVSKRVSEGGHDIPETVIERRYFRGINNLVNIYSNLVDDILVYDNNDDTPEAIYSRISLEEEIFVEETWTKIRNT
ncbi:zeta toxin family protein [uncultured Arcticibacterium sp.]|uniref:zeta toxin family protein n=1 Tax=uncultured Arcticibacterium sp. TaxID=2173042 RepID=UPI0030F60CCD